MSVSLPDSEYNLILRQNIGSRFFPDTGIRHHPGSIPGAERLGYKALLDMGLRELDFWHRTSQNSYDIENQTSLQTVIFPNLTSVSANLIIKNNANLSTLLAPNLVLPTFGSSLLGSSLTFSGNAIVALDVDQLFNTLALSLSSGVAYYCKIDTSGGTNAAPTAASSLARSSLQLGATAYHITIATN